jgi:Zn-dependent protease
MWVSLAGPLSNLVLAILAFVPLKFGFDLLKSGAATSPYMVILVEMLFNFLRINLMLTIFNLIPLAPLDGEKVLEFFLPAQAMQFFDRIRPYAPIALIGIFIVLPYLGIHVFELIMTPITNLLLILIGAK